MTDSISSQVWQYYYHLLLNNVTVMNKIHHCDKVLLLHSWRTVRESAKNINTLSNVEGSYSNLYQ